MVMAAGGAPEAAHDPQQQQRADAPSESSSSSSLPNFLTPARHAPSIAAAAKNIAALYPFVVDETKMPLPKCWSSKDKYHYLGLSQANLRIHYKGAGKNHKDAAAVRATHPIPAACGIYYFEVRIVSKGRDGYMGIGLSLRSVSLNRLPGWDHNSYGYHGDDGCSFCSSGQGRAYGPTFTTGDVIGCGLNLVDGTCFYTKNGQNLGVAFSDLPIAQGLYPTVGLQTPGEIVDANFGQEPFVYDIAADLREARAHIDASIGRFSVSLDAREDWMARLVADYLVHHGYQTTSSAFVRASNVADRERAPSGDDDDELGGVEDAQSVRDRQTIQKLILAGQIGDAIKLIQELYPSLLDRNADLLFMLRCRQFVEMVAAGSATEATKSEQFAVLDGMPVVGRRSPLAPRACSRSPPAPGATSPRRGSGYYASVSGGLAAVAPAAIGGSKPYRHSPLQSPRDSPRNSPRRAGVVVSGGGLKSPRSRQSPAPQSPFAASSATSSSLAASVVQVATTTVSQAFQQVLVAPTPTVDSLMDVDASLLSLPADSSSNSNSSSSSTTSSVLNGNEGSGGSAPTNFASLLSAVTVVNAEPVPVERSTPGMPPELARTPPAPLFGAATQNGASQRAENGHCMNGTKFTVEKSRSPVTFDDEVIGGAKLLMTAENDEKMVIDGDDNEGGGSASCDEDEYPTAADEPPIPRGRQLCGGSPEAIAQLISFGRELQALGAQLKVQQSSPTSKNGRMLRDAFSLLAYRDPFTSPVAYQLDPAQRELVASSVNSAILQLSGRPPLPALEVLVAQAQRLRHEMAKAGLGACAFIDPLKYLE